MSDNPTKFDETNALLFCMEPETVEQARKLVKLFYDVELEHLMKGVQTLFLLCSEEQRERRNKQHA